MQIEDVMENETYKKATEILEKYAPNRLHKLNEVRIKCRGLTVNFSLTQAGCRLLYELDFEAIMLCTHKTYFRLLDFS